MSLFLVGGAGAGCRPPSLSCYEGRIPVNQRYNMRLFIVERRTQDWGKMSLGDLLVQNMNLAYQSKEQLGNYLTIMKEWYDKYPFGFCEYRRRLKAIAHKTWAATGIEVISIDDVPKIGPAILLPTDDDDWYNPNIGTLVRENWEENDKALIWEGSKLGINTLRIKPNTKRPMTNAYAIRSDAPLVQISMHSHVVTEEHRKIKPTSATPST